MEVPVNDYKPKAAARLPTEPEQRLAELIVSALQLETGAAEIEPEAPLFGSGPEGGLGLDSIDALELALAISREYGIELRSDDQRNQQIFASLATLSAYVQAHRDTARVAPPAS
jgi:acyl carrier protein